MTDSNTPPANLMDTTATFDSPPSAPVIPAYEQLVYDEYIDLESPPSLVVTIIEALAEHATDLETVMELNIDQAVDPDGLTTVFRDHPTAQDRSGRVTFFLCGCRIVFSSDHRLLIYERPSAAESEK